MMRVLVIVFAVGVLAIPTGASTTTRREQAMVTTRACGSFKYGTDGQMPGPGGITARNVTCWFARAIALLGPAPGWHCANKVGLLFACQRGDAVVRFYGE